MTNRKHSGWRRGMAPWSLSVALCLSACHGPAKRMDEHTPVAEQAKRHREAPEPAIPDARQRRAEPSDGQALADDPERWLFVERGRPGEPDVWATGKFDQRRNKLIIETQNVRGFVIDVSRIPIDWERLVVIGIDGKNSELRKRNFSHYHFKRDEYGMWKVVE